MYIYLLLVVVVLEKTSLSISFALNISISTMLSSSSEEHQHHKGLNKNLVTHSSKSSSSTSSSYNHPINPILINSKTMEEVWKDINLSCSRDHIDEENTTTRTTNFGGIFLQDLLARPFANNDPSTTAYGSSVPPLPPPPFTMLTLNSGSEFHFFSNMRQTEEKNISNRSSFEALGAGRKRHPESDNNSCDQKSKRMIKNRESAARSRARKQESLHSLYIVVFYFLVLVSFI